MSTVILPVDDSEYALYAFQWYVSNFHKPDNKVILLHIPECYINATNMSLGRMIELQREADAKTGELKQKYLKAANDLGVKAEFCEEKNDNPGHGIVEVANKKNADLVVTGTRGLGKIRRTILGSVSDYVLHHVHCPVLICRHKDK